MTDTVLRQFAEEVARELGPAWYVDPWNRPDEAGIDVIHREAEFGQFRIRPMLGSGYRRVSVFGVLPETTLPGAEVQDFATSLSRPAWSVADWIREVLPEYMRSLAEVRASAAQDRPGRVAVDATNAASEGSEYPQAENAARLLSRAQHPAGGRSVGVRMVRGGLTGFGRAVLRALARQPAAPSVEPGSGSFVILVTDPQSGARFVYGPYAGVDEAMPAAARLRSDFAATSMDDLVLEVLTLIPLSWGPGEGGA